MDAPTIFRTALRLPSLGTPSFSRPVREKDGKRRPKRPKDGRRARNLAAAPLLPCSLAPLLFAFLASPILCAQFQPVNPEELKMTSDPKAPGAAAVFLNIEERTDDDLSYSSVCARIKVLTEKGKELATVSISYRDGFSKIKDIKARTIHPDGTVIPLVGKPDDLLTARDRDVKLGRKVFTLPSVEVGSIIEYCYTLQLPDAYASSPHWEIQRPYFVHKAHFEFKPLTEFGILHPDTGGDSVDQHGRIIKSMLWSSRLPDGVKVQSSASGVYSVDLADVPPIISEEWTPPVDAFRYQLSFFYVAAHGSHDYWLSEGKDWSRSVDKFAEPSSAIKAAVSSLVAPTDSELDKAKKLYAAIQTLDNTNYSREKSDSEMERLKIKAATRAEDTWTQKSGSSENIAMLYLAMLRAAGLKAYAVKVVDRDKGIFDPRFLSADELDSTLVILNAGGQLVLLDPGEKMCPFATVSWRHSLAAGLGQSAQGPSLTVTPQQQYADNIVRRTGTLALDERGGVTGQLQISMTGQEALRWRQTALQNDETEVKKQFDEELETIVPEGVHAHVDHFEAIDNPNVTLVALVNIDGTLGVATARRLVIPSFFFETRERIPFVHEENRMEPVDMHYANRVTDQVTYRLRSGMTVEGAPQDSNISWPDNALFVTRSLTQASQITTAQTLTRAFTIIKPENYQQLRGFYQKVATADQQQIVLARTAVLAGKEK
jgi:Domain of Unknown Function with PDB structure (DUF3857)/Transglutaminase-like superfamily